MREQATALVLGLVFLLAGAAAEAQTTVTNNNDGETNTIPVYTGGASLGNSPISTSGSYVGIGTTTSDAPLQVYGPIEITPASGLSATGAASALRFKNVNLSWEAGASEAALIQAITTFYGNDGNTMNALTFSIAGWGNNNAIEAMRIVAPGYVGIGTTNPGATLEVNGNVKLTSGSGASITFADGTVQSTAYTGVSCGGDFAESVDVTGNPKTFAPGDVLVLTSDGHGDVAKSQRAYSTMVAGIYSTKPGYVGRRLTGPKRPDEIPMAMVGIVPTKVSAENGPIHRGDLLVTASLPGYAMKGTDRNRMLGAVLGKAMGNLDSGTGVIETLVTLQ